MALFREVQRVPITRSVIEAVAQQQDFMRRIRADNGKGTRDRLSREGVLLLSGYYDAPLIKALSLPFCSGSEFVSYKPRVQAEVAIAANAGILLAWNG